MQIGPAERSDRQVSYTGPIDMSDTQPRPSPVHMPDSQFRQTHTGHIRRLDEKVLHTGRAHRSDRDTHDRQVCGSAARLRHGLARTGSGIAALTSWAHHAWFASRCRTCNVYNGQVTARQRSYKSVRVVKVSNQVCNQQGPS